MYRVETDETYGTPAFLAVEDEESASRSAARLLITGATQHAVETLARRIHAAGLRAGLPFVETPAHDLPIGSEALRQHCSAVLEAAAGGSMLISGIEGTPPAVQDMLLEVLAGLASTRRRSDAVRLMSGTTVSLLARVNAGTFSERLFYRLNTIHLVHGVRFNGTPAS
jgi:DNA-binding NtrC family response regulator